MTHRMILLGGLLAGCLLTGCNDAEQAKSEPSTADTSGPTKLAKAPAAKPEAPSNPEPKRLALFAGEPSTSGKTIVKGGMTWTQPKTWKGWGSKEGIGWSNPPKRVTGRLSFVYERDADWASVDGWKADETASSIVKVKGMADMKQPTACQKATYDAMSVPIKKQRWSAPELASFGPDGREGVVMAGQSGKWQFYCLRVVFSDDLALEGVVGYRTDKKGAEERATQTADLLRSLRQAG